MVSRKFNELEKKELLEEAKRFWMHMAKTNPNFQAQLKNFKKTGENEIDGENRTI